MFADYRVPQVLHYLGVLEYSNRVRQRLLTRQTMKRGHTYEIVLRALSIYAVQVHKLAV